MSQSIENCTVTGRAINRDPRYFPDFDEFEAAVPGNEMLVLSVDFKVGALCAPGGLCLCGANADARGWR